MLGAYDIRLGQGAICFVQEDANGCHINVAHCYSPEEAREWLNNPPWTPHRAEVTVAGRRRQCAPIAAEVARTLAELADEEAGAFRAAVAAGRWGEAADMVRRHARDQGFRGINSDALADWLAEGEWSGDETPEGVAEEWDSLD